MPSPPRRVSCGEDARSGRASSPRSPWGLGGARPRVEGAPRPPGSVRSGRTPGASAKTDPFPGGPRVRVPCSRVLIACTGGTPGCGGRSDRARGSGTQAHPVDGRGRARDRHVRRLDPAPHRDVSVRIWHTERRVGSRLPGQLRGDHALRPRCSEGAILSSVSWSEKRQAGHYLDVSQIK